MKVFISIIILFFSYSAISATAYQIECNAILKDFEYVNVFLLENKTYQFIGTFTHDNYNFNLTFEYDDGDNWKLVDAKTSNNFISILNHLDALSSKYVRDFLNQNRFIKVSDIEKFFHINFIKQSEKDIRKALKDKELWGDLSIKQIKDLINNFFREELKKSNFHIFGDPKEHVKTINNLKKGKPYLINFDHVSTEGNLIYLNAKIEPYLYIKGQILDGNNSEMFLSFENAFGIDGLFLGLRGNCNNQINFDNNSNNNENTIESKLQKLKSLFDKNLITQDEYDAKRKKILDAM